MKDVSRLALNDQIIHQTLGRGHVVKRDEEPHVNIKFQRDGSVRRFSNLNCTMLDLYADYSHQAGCDAYSPDNL